MYNHAPENYNCPLCLIINGEDNPDNFAKVDDIFYRDENIVALIGGKKFPNNDFNTIIIPTKHFENLYDLPEEMGHNIFDFSKRLAIALKEIYKCDGITVRQHNEPAGSQDVWHYHLHVTPRYTSDDLYLNNNNATWTTAEERAPFAQKLREYFKHE